MKTYSAMAWVVLLVLLDQLTKHWALHALSAGQVIPWLPGLQATLSFNAGIAFGWLANMAGLQIVLSVLLAVLVVIGAGIAWWRGWVKSPLLQASLVLWVAGSIGNAIDRLFLGYVIDFIDCFIGSWHWYTFNVADVALVLGTFLWLWHTYKEEH